MAEAWEPDTRYDRDAIVEYEGHKYKAIQPHNSQASPGAPPPWPHVFTADASRQADLAPPVSSATWERVDTPNRPGGDFLGEEIGDRLNGAFSGSRWDRDEEKRQTWSMEDWLRESEQRTRDYKAGRARGPVTWILVEGSNIPERAIPGGEEIDGSPQFICRAWYEGSLQVGKAGSSCRLGAIIGYANKEHHLAKYEILVGDQRALRWNECWGPLNLAILESRPVEGGREADGTPLFVARAKYHYAVVPGKCSERLSGAFIPYDNEEKECKTFHFLCYAQ